MIFTADQEQLAAATAWAASAIPAKNTQPVLGTLSLVAENGLLRITGTDYAETAIATIEASTAANGTVYAPGKFLADIVKALPRRPVNAELDGNLLRVTCGPAKFAMAVLPAGEGFGHMGVMPGQVGTMVGAEFGEAVQTVSRCASRDDTLPVLTGVYAQFAADHVLLVATDRYRMIAVKVPIVRDGEADLKPVLIPAQTLAGFARAAGGAGKVTFAYDGSNVVGFGDGTRQVVSRSVSGEFPKWQGRFDGSFPYTAVVNADLVIAAVKRVSVASDHDGAPVQLTFTGDEVTVEAVGSKDTFGSEIVPGVTFDGAPDTERTFKAEYLLDGLTGTRSELAQISMQASATKPVLITPAAADPAAEPDPDPAYRYITVPLRKASE